MSKNVLSGPQKQEFKQILQQAFVDYQDLSDFLEGFDINLQKIANKRWKFPEVIDEVFKFWLSRKSFEDLLIALNEARPEQDDIKDFYNQYFKSKNLQTVNRNKSSSQEIESNQILDHQVSSASNEDIIKNDKEHAFSYTKCPILHILKTEISLAQDNRKWLAFSKWLRDLPKNQVRKLSKKGCFFVCLDGYIKFVGVKSSMFQKYYKDTIEIYPNDKRVYILFERRAEYFESLMESANDCYSKQKKPINLDRRIDLIQLFIQHINDLTQSSLELLNLLEKFNFKDIFPDASKKHHEAHQYIKKLEIALAKSSYAFVAGGGQANLVAIEISEIFRELNKCVKLYIDWLRKLAKNAETVWISVFSKS